MSTLDLRALLEALTAHDVDFVVIGGVAVGAHGFVRGTADLDIVPNPTPTNLERLNAALVALESSLPTAGGRDFDRKSDGPSVLRGSNITTDTRFGGLDVVQDARGVPGYRQLASDAVEVEIFGTSVKICSLAKLRDMKEAQGRPQDRLDLENLPPE